MATRYAVGSGVWSNTSTVWSDSDGGAAGAYVPVDGDTVVISANVSVQVDVDQSAWTGLLGMTVRSHATTPGMVYWKDGTSGTLRFRTGADIVGTNLATFGRILANSDGVWANSGVLDYATKAIIIVDGTAKVDCTYLNIKMIPDEPTNKYVRAYKDKVDRDQATYVSAANDTIDVGAGDIGKFSAGLAVKVISSGTLPGGLDADDLYFVRGISGNTLKLALQNSDACIVDITSTGSGTLSLFTGHTDTATATVNVLEDVTADNWTAGDYASLIDIGFGDDYQRVTVNTINAGTFVLSANVDSAQYPLARIYLINRNCAIRNSTSTSSTQRIVQNGSGCTFGEISNTNGTGGYCYAIYGGVSHAISIIANVYSGFVSCLSCTLAIFVQGSSGADISGVSNVIGSIGGAHSAALAGTSGDTVTEIFGCASCFSDGSPPSGRGGNTVTKILGCATGGGNSQEIITAIRHCTNGNTGYENVIALISGCTIGLNGGNYNKVTTIYGCTTGVYSGQHNQVDNVIKCVTDFGNLYGDFYSNNGTLNYPMTFQYRNRGNNNRFFVRCDNFGGTYGSHRVYQCYGDSLKVTAGVGSPTPDQRAGGNAYLIELSSLQSYLSTNILFAFAGEKVRIWATASTSKTYRFYIQSTFDLTAAELVLKGTYLSSGADGSTTDIESDETVDARSGITDWSQYLEVTINPSQTGWITFAIDLKKYSAGGQVFIDPLVVIS